MKYKFAHTIMAFARTPGTSVMAQVKSSFVGPDGQPLHYKCPQKAQNEAKALSKEHPELYIAVVSVEEVWHQGGCDAVEGEDSPGIELRD